MQPALGFLFRFNGTTSRGCLRFDVRPENTVKAIIALFLIAASCVPNDTTGNGKQATEVPVRRNDLESKLQNAVKQLDHGRGELKATSASVLEYSDGLAVVLKATLKGETYFRARLAVDAVDRVWEADFGKFRGDHSSKDTELAFRIDKKNTSNAVFMFAGTCGEWFAKDVPGQSNTFFKATDLKFLNGSGKAEQAVPSDGHKPSSRAPSDGPTAPADAP